VCRLRDALSFLNIVLPVALVAVTVLLELLDKGIASRSCKILQECYGPALNGELCLLRTRSLRTTTFPIYCQSILGGVVRVRRRPLRNHTGQVVDEDSHDEDHAAILWSGTSGASPKRAFDRNAAAGDSCSCRDQPPSFRDLSVAWRPFCRRDRRSSWFSARVEMLFRFRA
jgi:hypothetical protein